MSLNPGTPCDNHGPACICEVCTCGGHKCPPPAPEPTHYDPSVIRSEYQVDYPGHTGGRPPSARPRQSYVPGPKFDGESSYHHDYVPIPLPDRELQAAAPEAAPHIPFEGCSVYDKDFVPVHGDVRRPYRPRQEPVNGGVFDGQTTNRQDYPAPPNDAYARPENFDAPPAAPHIPFEGSTTNRSDYGPKPIEPKFSRPRQGYVPSDARFDGESVSHADFRPPAAADYPVAMSPAPVAQAPHVPFEGSTTNRSDYGPKPIEPRHARQAPGYTPSAARFEGESVSHADYRRPDPSAYPKPDDPHYDNLNSRGLHPEIPFEGQTTNRADYDRKPLETPYQRARQVYTPSGVRFDGESTSHADYSAHEVEVCPAALLPRRPPSPERHIYYDERTVGQARERARELSPPRR